MMDGKVSNIQQIASVRRYTLTGGIEDGLKVIDCDNGNIRFLLNESKALDIMQVYHQGTNISFISKNGFVNREIPFLNRFEGGMLYTCGLDSIGAREGYEFHGSLHNKPAQIVRTECNDKGIVVEAILRRTSLFGVNLLLKRKISTELGGDSITLEDTLINAGYQDAPYCLLYHINIGYPMLDETTKWQVALRDCRARTAWAKENEKSMFTMQSPTPMQEETCYFLQLEKPNVIVWNEKLGKSFTLSYSGETLPCFIEWKSVASGDYALGLEPCTTELDDGFAHKILKSDQSKVFWVKLTIKNI